MKPIATIAILIILGIAGYETYTRWIANAEKTEAKAPPADPWAHCRSHQQKLAKRIYAIIDSARSDIAIYTKNISNGCTWGHRADIDFPLASLNKIPIAAKVLSEVDSGRLALNTPVVITYDDLRPFTYLGALVQKDKPIQLTVKELLEYMLQQSDNCSADKLLQLVGGVKSVEQFTHRHGFTGIRLQRTLFQLFADLYQMDIPQDNSQWTFSNWETWTGTVTEANKEQGRKAIHSDLSDKASARNLTELLEYIALGKMLSQSNTRLLFEMLENCQRGKERLPALLPASAWVAHKTGTLRGMVHDMGILTQREDSGYLLVSVLIKNSPRSLAEDEALIAKITKIIYDDF